MGKNKGKKKKGGDDSDEEPTQPTVEVAEGGAEESRAQKRAAKKEKRAGKVDSDKHSLSSMLTKLNVDDDESSTKRAEQEEGVEDEDDEEEEEEPVAAPVSKNKKKEKKKGGQKSFAMLNDSDDEDEEEEEEEPVAAPVSKNKKKDKKKGGQQKAAAKSFAMLNDSDDDDVDDEEDAEDQEEEINAQDVEEEEEEASTKEATKKSVDDQETGIGGDLVVPSSEGGKEEEDEFAQLQKKKDAGSITKEEKRRYKELKKGVEEEAGASSNHAKGGGCGGLSKEEKKELKVLKAKKENDGGLTKEEKRRYKDLKAAKKGTDEGGGGEEEEEEETKKKPALHTAAAAAASYSSTSAVWPPPAPKPESKVLEDDGPSSPQDGDQGGKTTAQAKPAKMTKLQLKMEAAKLRKLEAEKEKAEAAAVLAAAAPPSVAVKGSNGKHAAGTSKSGGGAAAAAEEEEVDEEAAAKRREQEQELSSQRVFNMGDDDGWKDASVPGSSLAQDVDDEGEISETGPDGKRRTKKEMKKLHRDRELRQKEKEQYADDVARSLEGAQFSCSQTSVDEKDPLWLNSLDINIPSITISAYNKNLFVDAPLTIAHGRHYGLVGPNGKGKSTLLKMIASGALKIPPRIDALYVEQEVHADETPAFEAVLMADKPRWALIKEERELVASLSKAPDEAKDTRLAAVYEEMTAMDAAGAEPKARRILYGLGFDSEMQNRATREFSGGWRMRISLARALFIEPTLLMLDEPTNHLDLNAVIWLDDYLQKWKKTLLIVSHDQDFLNTTCEEILHLNAQKLDSYRGNYDTFKQLENKKREQAQKAWELEQKRIKQLKAGGTTKAKANQQVLSKKTKEQAGAKKKKDDAIASGADSADIRQLLERPKDYQVTLQFGEVQKLQPPVIQVMDVGFRYAPQLPPIFDSLNFGVDMESRICVVGNNGSGKSTLIKLLIGEVNESSGEVRRNPRLQVGVYNQHFVDKLPMDASPVEYLRNSFDGLDYQSARNILGKFGLEGHAHEIAMRDLSGGQKARVTFCELTLAKPHVLFLDEPTNNLDIESIDALCEAINAYEGGMVVVTHDARLIEATESQLWVVEDREVIAWDGGFTTYRDHLLRKLEEQMEALHPNKAKASAER